MAHWGPTIMGDSGEQHRPKRWAAILGWLALLVAISAVLFYSTPKVLWLRENVPELSVLALTLLGVFVILRGSASWVESKPALFRAGAIFLIAFAGVGFWFGAQDKAKLQAQIRALTSPTGTEVTTQDIRALSSAVQALKDDLSNLRADTKIASDNIVIAISSLQSSMAKTSKDKKLPSKPVPTPETGSPAAPPVSETPPTSVGSLGPSVVQHAQWTQRRTNSTRDDAKFALQLIIQTDTPSQPTAFLIETSGDMVDGEFFVAGQPVMMGVSYGVQADKRHFYLRFQYPAFTPEAPIVVTLLSKSDMVVTSVSRARP